MCQNLWQLYHFKSTEKIREGFERKFHKTETLQ
jgi:hypothetical protein